ncbi:hypothetical protein AMTRI_Chr07g25230 [Amborella trichopoda]|uniref:Uncharacterized protein n=1 Tax=Amborella trichopoda TaxID=13333 RepID=U5D3E8_AMBTC|nr:hypothetical protein AMTR_s00039p00236920 [Amborella trichopoda]
MAKKDQYSCKNSPKLINFFQDHGFTGEIPLPKKTQFTIGFVGLGLGISYFYRAHSMRYLATTIKLADKALKGMRTLHKLQYPSPYTFVVACKALIKGYNVSKRLNLVNSSNRSSSLISQRLKAYFGALNLARYAHSMMLVSEQLGFSGYLNTVYKLSKNLARVLEGVMGIHLETIGSSAKKSFETVQLIAKAFVLTKQFYQVASFFMCHGVFEAFRIASVKRPFTEKGKDGERGKDEERENNEVSLNGSFVRVTKAHKSNNWISLSHHCFSLSPNCVQFEFINPLPSRPAPDGESLEPCISEVLCLSLPIFVKVL